MHTARPSLALAILGATLLAASAAHAQDTAVRLVGRVVSDTLPVDGARVELLGVTATSTPSANLKARMVVDSVCCAGPDAVAGCADCAIAG